MRRLRRRVEYLEGAYRRARINNCPPRLSEVEIPTEPTKTLGEGERWVLDIAGEGDQEIGRWRATADPTDEGYSPEYDYPVLRILFPCPETVQAVLGLAPGRVCR